MAFSPDDMVIRPRFPVHDAPRQEAQAKAARTAHASKALSLATSLLRAGAVRAAAAVIQSAGLGEEAALARGGFVALAAGALAVVGTAGLRAATGMNLETAGRHVQDAAFGAMAPGARAAQLVREQLEAREDLMRAAFLGGDRTRGQLASAFRDMVQMETKHQQGLDAIRREALMQVDNRLDMLGRMVSESAEKVVR